MAISNQCYWRFVEPVEDILDFFVTRLNATSEINLDSDFTDFSVTNWTVAKYNGTSNDELLLMIPSLSLPAAVVAYQSGQFDELPRRELRVGVLLVTRAFADDQREVLNNMIDQAGILLDHQTYNQALIRADQDVAIDLGEGEGVAAALFTFQVDDH